MRIVLDIEKVALANLNNAVGEFEKTLWAAVIVERLEDNPCNSFGEGVSLLEAEEPPEDHRVDAGKSVRMSHGESENATGFTLRARDATWQLFETKGNALIVATVSMWRRMIVRLIGSRRTGMVDDA